MSDRNCNEDEVRIIVGIERIERDVEEIDRLVREILRIVRNLAEDD